jgi:hypothetical protein
MVPGCISYSFRAEGRSDEFLSCQRVDSRCELLAGGWRRCQVRAAKEQVCLQWTGVGALVVERSITVREQSSRSSRPSSLESSRPYPRRLHPRLIARFHRRN